MFRKFFTANELKAHQPENNFAVFYVTAVSNADRLVFSTV